MWHTKYFDTQTQMNSWIDKHKHKYQIDVIYIDSGFAIEYRELRSL